MAFTPPVPIHGSVHWDDIRLAWALKATREDPKTSTPFSVNQIIELLEKAATLLEIISIMVDFFAGLPPTIGVAPGNDLVGDWHKFADWAARRAGGVYTPPP